MKGPKFSLIMTAFSEEQLLRLSIDSILNQSYDNFELILVDDGANKATSDIIDNLDDGRIIKIRQANAGLSSARNKGLEQVSGDYLCFLDADDIRPSWAFDTFARALRSQPCDVMLCQGMLSEIRGQLLPFYDIAIFQHLGVTMGEETTLHVGSDLYTQCLGLLYLLEPQSANKVIRTDFLKQRQLCFPNGHYFEDMFFHAMAISQATSVGIIQQPCFTYFRRYAQPQLTHSASAIRIDSLAVAQLTLEAFSASGHFHQPLARTALLANLFKLVSWCEESTSHHYRHQFRQLLAVVKQTADPLYFELPAELPAYLAPFEQSLDYARRA